MNVIFATLGMIAIVSAFIPFWQHTKSDWLQIQQAIFARFGRSRLVVATEISSLLVVYVVLVIVMGCVAYKIMQPALAQIAGDQPVIPRSMTHFVVYLGVTVSIGMLAYASITEPMFRAKVLSWMRRYLGDLKLLRAIKGPRDH
jgi:hypothetical protein